MASPDRFIGDIKASIDLPPKHPFLQTAPSDLLYLDSGPSTWKYFGTWAVVRMFGCWPFLVIGGADPVQTLTVCPSCGQGAVGVDHGLLSWLRSAFDCGAQGKCHLQRVDH